MERIDCNSRDFFNDDRVEGVDKILLLIQICNLLYCLQESCGFTHGDMHNGNIMVKKEYIEIVSAIDPKMRITSKYRPYFIDLGLACADLSLCCKVKRRYVANGIYKITNTNRCKNKSQDMRLYLFTLFTLYTAKDAKAKTDDKENELKTYLTGLFKKKDCIFSRSIPLDFYEKKQRKHKHPFHAFYKDTETINDPTFYPENIFYDLMQLLVA
jgi:5-methylthioribose kinase